MTTRLVPAVYVGFVVLLAGMPTLAAQGAAPRISYNEHIKPILSGSCFSCHGPDAHDRKAGLRLDTREGALARRKGVAAIVPGKPEESALWLRVTHADPAELMPPPKAKKPRLRAEQLSLLRRWIEAGAEYEQHWAFVPARLDPAERRLGIDDFLTARLRAQGLQAGPMAERRTLIRRLSLDLTGLLPTPAEVQAFVADRREDAVARLVDGLLARPSFGERMAVEWLDAARFADSSAYHADGPRDMWRWRDEVVRSFNRNQPFDQFTREQLAGDLIPDATVRQRVASGFNRNHCTSDEGGAFPEELRVGYIVDRVRTTSMVWLGLSMECGQCHDHKYDPISQREYYRFYAYFNNTADPGMQTRNGNQKPVVEVPDPERQRQLAPARAELRALQRQLQERETQHAQDFASHLLDAEVYGAPPPPEVRGLTRLPLDAAPLARGASRLVGAPRFVAGRVGKALALDRQGHAVLEGLGDYERDQAFSAGAWIRARNKGYGAALARMKNGGTYRGWDLYVGANQGVSVHLIHAWDGNALKVTTERKLPRNQWRHVFFTYDGSSKSAGLRIYVDGEHWPHRIERNSLRGTIRTGSALRIGRREGGSVFVGEVDELCLIDRQLAPAEVAALADRNLLRDYVRTPPSLRTPQMRRSLKDSYMARRDPRWSALRQEIVAAKARVTALSKPLTTVMVMQERKQLRPTMILDRGAYDSPKGEALQPGVPAALLWEGAQQPRDRLELAEWLVDPRHPLTARVTVNRVWKMLMGRGIVRSLGDFGSQGDYPSHPRLLDWLAVRFVESGWDIKALIREIVLSQAYRRSAAVGAELRRLDPENQLLSRGPRFRLAAEFIRDIALQSSGLLVDKLGGPSVKPYQPPGLWNEVSLNRNLRFRQDSGEKLYRRSLYTYWKRSAPAPSMRIFDAPTRERCVVDRGVTNTPLQALVGMNDPQFIEAARHLAARMMQAVGFERRLSLGFQLLLCRDPRPRELVVLEDSFRALEARYRRDPAAARALLSVGDSKPHDLPSHSHAAWTMIANTLLNLDETLTH